MILDGRLHPVEEAIASSTLVRPDGVVLVGVSGGADSMALLDALRVAADGVASTVVVAHFDHRLREDSAQDAEHVRAYARKHGLEFVLGTVDVALRARSKRTSIEETARDSRYEFFTEVLERLHARCVATAHTRTDQIETILMRILRGSGHVGIAGIPRERGAFVRPLLEVTRADTRNYCETHGVAFVDDPSNADVRFLRNRLRHEVLPELRAAFPSIDDTLLRLARSGRREHDAFSARTAGWIDENVTEEESGVWALRLAGFATIDDDDATGLLREALVKAGSARDVGRKHYRRLLALVRSNHAGSAVDIPGLSARREHDAIVLRRTASERPAATECTAELCIPGRTRVGDWIVEADFVFGDEARRGIAAQSKGPGTSTVYFDAAAITLPLRARRGRPGDAMRPLGLGGRKKLSDLFIDMKIPRRRRERALVIEGSSIYWVPGIAKSDLVRIGVSTELALRMKATFVENRRES